MLKELHYGNSYTDTSHCVFDEIHQIKYTHGHPSSYREEIPEQLLTEYFERTEIETVFKTSKEYLGLLPLSKWTDTTVRGKILHDIIAKIILLKFREKILLSGASVSELAGKTQSLMCFLSQNKKVNVETPSKQVKQYYNLFSVKTPAHLELDEFKTDVAGL